MKGAIKRFALSRRAFASKTIDVSARSQGEVLTCGANMSDHILESDWTAKEGWHAPTITPHHRLHLDPVASNESGKHPRSGGDALAAQHVVLWVKRSEFFEKDYRSVSVVLPSNGEDLKKASVAVLAPRGTTVSLEDIKLYRVQTDQASGEPPLPAEVSSALSRNHFPSSRQIEHGMDGKHFLISGLSGEMGS